MDEDHLADGRVETPCEDPEMANGNLPAGLILHLGFKQLQGVQSDNFLANSSPVSTQMLGLGIQRIGDDLLDRAIRKKARKSDCT